ncbi:DUF2057 domain-containing protein [Photobacterium sp.]|uniref:YccT family protein n=1 Tax=Photobacterium sp. TaxID=660 RepID=UPI00299D50F4|nr:DUF2057 domain-containing protein [Photobacterium sp.]MDX1303207.1 DUF2057 domain-containing protein [Photobacterium sp.]
MKKLTLAALFMLSASVHAATLSTSENIELLVVDGKKVLSSYWSPTKSIELTNGKHQIVVRFDGEVKNGSKGTIFTTRPYLFDFNVADKDATIVLPNLTTLSQAKAHFERGADWSLEYADGMKETIKYTELQGAGFAAFSDMEALVADYNSQNGIVFEQGYAVDLEKVAVQVTEQGEVKITGDSLTQLKMWYTKASDKEKKAFKIWMAEHDFN